MKTTFSRLFSSAVVILLVAQLLLGIFFQLMVIFRPDWLVDKVMPG